MARSYRRTFLCSIPPLRSPVLSWFGHSVAKRLDEQDESRRGLTTARIIEVIARIRRAPIRKHALKTALGKMGLRHILRHIGEAEPGERRIQHLESAVEDEPAFDMHLELAPILLEFPG